LRDLYLKITLLELMI